VTPSIAVSTRDVFAAFDAIRSHGDSSVRMTSTHLAEELRAKLSTADLVARAGAMTVANDLLPAVALVVPSIVPFRRALSRLLARPIGLSGSGPTLWALYDLEAEAEAAAGIVRTAVRDERLVAPGSGEPFVTATTIEHGQHGQHGQQGSQP
jgi:4-diphosphocytidyl-2C-methyl-D-erythritol kinase